METVLFCTNFILNIFNIAQSAAIGLLFYVCIRTPAFDYHNSRQHSQKDPESDKYPFTNPTQGYHLLQSPDTAVSITLRNAISKPLGLSKEIVLSKVKEMVQRFAIELVIALCVGWYHVIQGVDDATKEYTYIESEHLRTCFVTSVELC